MTGPELGAFDFLAHNDAVLELSRRDLFIKKKLIKTGLPQLDS